MSDLHDMIESFLYREDNHPPEKEGQDGKAFKSWNGALQYLQANPAGTIHSEGMDEGSFVFLNENRILAFYDAMRSAEGSNIVSPVDTRQIAEFQTSDKYVTVGFCYKTASSLREDIDFFKSLRGVKL